MDDGPDPVREASVPGTGALATQGFTKVYMTPLRAAALSSGLRSGGPGAGRRASVSTVHVSVMAPCTSAL